MSTYKLAVCGSGGVGKSAITVQYIRGEFLEYYDPTIEDFYKKQITIGGEVCFLEILDTAGQEEYSALQDGYMRSAEAFLLVFSITEEKSIQEIAKYRDNILRAKDAYECPMVIFGNKADLESQRQVSKTVSQEVAKEWKAPLFEGSAKSATNITEAFAALVEELKKARAAKEQKNSSNSTAKQQQKENKAKKKKKCNLL